MNKLDILQNYIKNIPDKSFWMKETESTNEIAASLALKGYESLVIADRQTKGRGRGDHTFESNEGGLYMSIGYQLTGDINDALHFQLLAADAVMNALKTFGIVKGARVKWPNDIYLNDKKICGILCQAVQCFYKEGPVPLGTWFIVTGIGINLTNKLSEELVNADNIFNLTGIQLETEKMAAEIYRELIRIYAGNL